MIIGVLGAGQLGQMLRDASAHLPLEVRLYDLAAHTPEALTAFLASVELVTFETENIREDILAAVEASGVRAAPGTRAIRTCQHRMKEKRQLRALGIATAPFEEVTDRDSLQVAVERLGYPLILKTQTEGYDGKGQALLRSEADLEPAWAALGDRPLIAEGFVRFSREVSIIAARGAEGALAFYDVVENHHHEGILRYTLAPAPALDAHLTAQARDYARLLLEALDYQGVMTLEMFVTDAGLVANEIAPRVHNSGHWSIEGAHCSQFENHLRGVAGLPLGDTGHTHGYSAMLNVIGDETPCDALKRQAQAFFHSYGKSARPGRKLGHVTVTADTPAQRAERLSALLPLLPEVFREDAPARAALP